MLVDEISLCLIQEERSEGILLQCTPLLSGKKQIRLKYLSFSSAVHSKKVSLV